MSKTTRLLIVTLIGLSQAGDSLRQNLHSKAFQPSAEAVSTLPLDRASAFLESNPDSALFYGQIALQASRRNKMLSDEAKALILIGQSFFQQSRYDSAMNYFIYAKQFCEEIGHRRHLATVCSHIGITHSTLGNYSDALPYLQKCLVIEQELDNENGVAETYLRLGQVFGALGDFDEAIRCLQIPLDSFKKNKMFRQLAFAQNSLAGIYEAMGKFNGALHLQRRALAIARDLNDTRLLAIVLSDLAHLNVIMGNDPQAHRLYQQAVHNFRSCQDAAGECNVLRETAELYIKEFKYDLALEYLHNSRQLAEKLHLRQETAKTFQIMAKLHAHLGQFQLAWQDENRYAALRDSLFDKALSDKAAELGVSLEAERRGRELSLLKREARMQKNIQIFLSIIVMLVLTLTVTVFNRYRTKRHSLLELEENHKRIQKAEEELIAINTTLTQRITEAVATQMEQERALVQQSKLAGLGELAAGIAHEINQPLSGILMGLQNLQIRMLQNDMNPDYLMEKLKNLSAYAERIKKIIEHIRIFSREQTSVLCEPFHLQPSILDAQALIGEQYRHHQIALTLDLSAPEDLVMGNRWKFEQVVLNLLSNSRDSVEQRFLRHEPGYAKQIRIHTVLQDQEIILTVCDNGVGIPDQDVTRIFEPFFTTKSPDQGTGLGLSISYGIVKEMSGNIMVESVPNDHTCFTIRLPLAGDPAIQSKRP
jgi:two-component system, NtrC family, sensor kinase